MKPMIDFHTHVLFGVDDGPNTLNDALKMLHMMKQQGITKVVLTPHVNTKNIHKKDLQERNFSILEELANKIGMKLYLGAEIYIPNRLPDLPFKNYAIGNKNVLLLEFSPLIECPIIEHVYRLSQQGFTVVIAHIERYQYLTFDDYFELKNLGIYFQVNSSSLLKSPFNRYYKLVRKLINEDMVDIVASDAHNLSERSPNLDVAFKLLSKIKSIDYAKKLLLETPEYLLN